MFLECRYGRRQYIYDTPIDMWSLGCLAMELYLGQPLFEGRSSLEMINGIVNLLGKFKKPKNENILHEPNLTN